MPRLAFLARLTPLLALLLAAPAVAAEPPLKTGIWRAEAQLFGMAVPFLIEVERDQAGHLAVFYRNGAERMPVEQVVYSGGDRIELNFPSYLGSLRASIADGRLAGVIELQRARDTLVFPVAAEHGVSWRFFPDYAEDYVDLSGTWRTEIRQRDAEPGRAPLVIGMLQQDGPRLTGTFQSQVGDYRFAEGQVRGNRMYLSAFDGGYIHVWQAELGADGVLQGPMRSIGYTDGWFEAVRDADAALQPSDAITYLKPGVGRFDFTFPDAEGKPVSLSDARFQGKPVIVLLSGSWCPTCHDEAAFMGPLYQEYRDRGLEIVSLQFEFQQDPARVARQIAAFRKRYGIAYPMLFAGHPDRQTRGEALPQLNDIHAFPTSIFIDRKGAVRKIHSAFPGPATGDRHTEHKAKVRALVEELLAEDGA